MEKLPAIFAAFNGISFVCIISAYALIKGGNRLGHKKFMLTALGASAIFLALYLIYHFSIDEPVRYQGEGFIRMLYFTILITHTVLAVVILPMIIVSVKRALKGEDEKHKKIARITFPLWSYVSLTGVVIYFMLWGF